MATKRRGRPRQHVREHPRRLPKQAKRIHIDDYLRVTVPIFKNKPKKAPMTPEELARLRQVETTKWEYNQARRKEKTSKLNFLDNTVKGEPHPESIVSGAWNYIGSGSAESRLRNMRAIEDYSESQRLAKIKKPFKKISEKASAEDAKKLDWITKHPNEIPPFMNYNEYRHLMAKYDLGAPLEKMTKESNKETGIAEKERTARSAHRPETVLGETVKQQILARQSAKLASEGFLPKPPVYIKSAKVSRKQKSVVRAVVTAPPSQTSTEARHDATKESMKESADEQDFPSEPGLGTADIGGKQVQFTEKKGKSSGKVTSKGHTRRKR